MTEKLSNLSRVLYDKVVGEYLIGNDIGFDGETIVQQFVQSDLSDTWEIALNVRGFVTLIFVFQDNEDDTFTLVQPQNVERITEEDLRITFSIPIKGVANIMLATDGTEKFLGAVTPTVTPTKTVTPTPEPTISVTPSPTPTMTLTPNASLTPTPSVTATPAVTPTISTTPSITASVTPVASPTSTPAVTATPTATAGVTPTVTATVTPSPTPTITAAVTVTPTPTVTGTPAASPTVTPSPTTSVTATPTITPAATATQTPAVTASVTPAASATPAVTPTVTATQTPAVTPTVTPTVSPPSAVSNTGFVQGGYDGGDVHSIPFASPFTSGSVLGQVNTYAGSYRAGTGGVTDSLGSTGFAVGGFTGTTQSEVDSFPFAAPFTTSTLQGNLRATVNLPQGYNNTAQSATDGRATGGYAFPNSYDSQVHGFPFAAPFTGDTVVAFSFDNLSFGSTSQDSTDWYTQGGYTSNGPAGARAFIYRHPFITPYSISTTIGDLITPKWGTAGHSSATDGYASGGYESAPVSAITTVETFPFSSPFTNATVAGNLNGTRRWGAGLSSSTDGISAGNDSGIGGGAPVAEVTSFPFAAPFTTSTDIGDVSTSPTFTGFEGPASWST